MKHLDSKRVANFHFTCFLNAAKLVRREILSWIYSVRQQ